MFIIKERANGEEASRIMVGCEGNLSLDAV
jgi:hypothetical protein